jgi:hypothetical protein
MLLALKLGARRQIHFELDSPVSLANLNALAGVRQDTLPHGDTVEHFLGHVPTRSLQALRRRMVRRLVRMKALEQGRLHGHLLVAVDGTGQLHFRQRHCAHCLRRRVHGKLHYSHHVLEAKLITPAGLALSMATEFIENANPRATKQDCERKAFVRLAGRLKRDYPQLRLCLCLDALYATGPVLSLCEANHWRYLITFKQGSLPALWQEYGALRDLCPAHRHTVQCDAQTRQQFAWVEHLEHIDDQQQVHHPNAFECQEDGPQGPRYFAWLTNFPLRRDSVSELANRGGRCRWKIENEGFIAFHDCM